MGELDVRSCLAFPSFPPRVSGPASMSRILIFVSHFPPLSRLSLSLSSIRVQFLDLMKFLLHIWTSTSPARPRLSLPCRRETGTGDKGSHGLTRAQSIAMAREGGTSLRPFSPPSMLPHAGTREATIRSKKLPGRKRTAVRTCDASMMTDIGEGEGAIG